VQRIFGTNGLNDQVRRNNYFRLHMKVYTVNWDFEIVQKYDLYSLIFVVYTRDSIAT